MTENEYINKIRREFNALADALPDPPKRIRKKKVLVEKPLVDKPKPKPVKKHVRRKKKPPKPKMGDKLNKRSDYRYTDSVVRMYGKRSARRIINLTPKSK